MAAIINVPASMRSGLCCVPTNPCPGCRYCKRSGSRTFDRHPYFIEKVGQVNDFGLPGGIFYSSGALNAGGGQHDIDGGADADQVEINMAAVQAVPLQQNIAVINITFTAQGLKPF